MNTPICPPTQCEKSELRRFADALPVWSPMRKACLEISESAAPIIPAAFDACMKAYRAWLVFDEMPDETAPDKAKLFKTARALVSCAKFKAGDMVAVRYFSTDENGTHWFECATEKFPDLLPPCWYKSACYPEHHLTEFCL